MAVFDTRYSGQTTSLSALGEGTRGLQNGPFWWVTSNGNITGLQFTMVGADAIPEPSTLALIAMAGLSTPALLLSRKSLERMSCSKK